MGFNMFYRYNLVLGEPRQQRLYSNATCTNILYPYLHGGARTSLAEEFPVLHLQLFVCCGNMWY